MQKEEVLKILAQHRKELQEQFGVKKLALFGSTARSEATAGSDVDILVEFNQPAGFFHLARTRYYLQQLLSTQQVDLVTYNGIRPSIKERVLREAVYA